MFQERRIIIFLPIYSFLPTMQMSDFPRIFFFQSKCQRNKAFFEPLSAQN